jgi:cell division transport system permease protein
MRAWLRHHRQSLAATLARLARQPGATLLNIAAIGVALALPLGAYVVLENGRSLARQVAGDPQLTVFLAPDATRADADRIAVELKRAPGVRGARFVPRDEALAELKRIEGVEAIAGALKANPLPDAFVVDLVPGQAAAAEALAARAREFPKVAQVQLDATWVKRLEGLLALGRTAVGVLAAFLAVGLVAVTFNTVRLQILTQAAEIEVSRLVGATDGHIRRPFLYLGGLLGGLGGIAAVAAVAGAIRAMNTDVALLAASYGSGFRLAMPPIADIVSVLAFAAALGWMGAWLSVSRHLQRPASS